ncbi:MAG: nuclease [Verrucomicrobia bacterium]|nr:nuclease [Verrucomicrobiota bacterium]
MKHPITVFADDRESRADVIAALERMPEIDLKIARLQTGDYRVDGGVIFERKTARDFAASVADGRLFTQARRLVRCSDQPVLIIEGSPFLTPCGVSREALQGAIISTSIIFRIPILFAKHSQETADLIVYAALQTARHTKGLSRRPGRTPKYADRLRLHFLQGLPRIGTDKAKLLLEHFGSVEAVVSATARDLTQVKGIGSKTADAIHDLMTTRISTS